MILISKDIQNTVSLYTCALYSELPNYNKYYAVMYAYRPVSEPVDPAVQVGCLSN